MAQRQASSGLRIDTSFTSGQLSLHEYRKFLSRQDTTIISPISPRPRLKRKPAALNLCQRQHHDSGFQYQSPVSSTASSPPPLSFCQSVISFTGGDLLTPISPTSIVRPFSQPVSSNHLSGRRLDPFSARLKNQKQNFASHSRTSSDLTLPSNGTPILRVRYSGAEFDILNPSVLPSYYDSAASYRLSSHFKDTMKQESPDTSPAHSFTSYGIPDDMIRPISASESAVLSKFTSPAPSPGLPQSSHSFAALPPLKETPSTPVSPRSPRAPAKSLKQKVSRLFGGSDKRSSSRNERDSREKNDGNDRDVPRSPLSDHWEAEREESVESMYQPAAAETTIAEQEDQDSSHHDPEELTHRRRSTWRPHSSNRHQTLQDALRQLEVENNGLTFGDIMRYIGAEDEDGVVSGDDDGPQDEKVERPWQPDTWNEPTQVRMPHNRPSDSNLSTNAPSTRASIRPYVERAAAFMAAGGSVFSASTSSSDPAEERDEMERVKLINDDENEDADADGEQEEEEEEEEEGGETTEDDSEPAIPLRRIISRRARPLSSNPPDLDTPILYDSESSASDDGATAAPSPKPTSAPQPVTRISWSPEIPPRHPDHRVVRFEDFHTTFTRVATPPPQASSAPRVVTTTIAPRKKQKKQSSGCHCL